MMNHGNKDRALLFLRVSTAQQEIKSQEVDLRKLARRDGFTDDQILVIGQVGASAIKLNDLYRQELESLLDRLENDKSIKSVYVWEVSRLARVESVFFKVKEILIKNKIQLVIFSPTLRLFNDDGTLNSGTEAILSLLSTLSKQEMENKKARTKRGRDKNRELGKFNGGPIRGLYGYKVDKDGFIVPDDEERKIVEEVFSLYSTGKYSFRTLSEELRLRGYNFRGRKITDSVVCNTLKNPAYIGLNPKTGRKYHPIVNRKLWDKCKKVREDQDLGISKTKTKKIHLASKILKCSCCGYNYVATKKKYSCYKHSLSFRFDEGDKCKESVSINIDIMDRVLWEVAVEEDKRSRTERNKESVPGMKEEMKIAGKKIETLNKNYLKLQQKEDRIIENFEDDIIDKETRDQKLKAVKKEILETDQKIYELRKRINMFRFDILRIVKGINSFPGYDQFNDEQKREIIVERILKASLRKSTDQKGRKVIIIDVELIRGGKVQYFYYYTLKDRERQLKRI